MASPSRIIMHLAALAASVAAAVLLVSAINRHYWSVEPYPGGRPASEVAADEPWMEVGIQSMVELYSLPLGLIVFASLYGAAVSAIEIGDSRRIAIATTFLYPFVEVAAAVLFTPLFFGTVLGTLMFLFAMAKKDRLVAALGFLAVAVNAIFSFIGYNFARDWFALFGD